MPQCQAPGCTKFTRFETGKDIYCVMHLARLKRGGSLEKQTFYHKLEVLPHESVNDIILANIKKTDAEVVSLLHKEGFTEACVHHVGYRRRRLGAKKYQMDTPFRQTARRVAFKAHGKACEFCDFGLFVDVHHILSWSVSQNNHPSNLVVLCPNCHGLVTRKIVKIDSRTSLNKARKQALSVLRRNNAYTSLLSRP